MNVIRYRTKNEVRHGLLVKTTKKKIYVLLIGYKLNVKKINKTEMRYISVIDYKVNRAKRSIKRFAKLNNIKLSNESKNALRI
jgi:hypothetical protein